MNFIAGKPMLDVDGNVIHAHAGGLLYENGLWYWYGENKEKSNGKNGIWTWGINLYSSPDLEHWKKEGLIIPPDPEDKTSSLHPARHVDRPHILFCKRTGCYVCWLKISGKDAYFVVLTAEKIHGPYTIVRDHIRPFGHKAGDFDLYHDENGDGYIFFEHDHSGVIAAHLSPDYLDIQAPFTDMFTGLKPPMTREGITHFLWQGKHYLLSSGMSAYVPNASEVAVAESPLGPYHVIGDPHRNDDSGASFNSQVSCVAMHPVYPGLFLVLADRWISDLHLTKKDSERIRDGISAVMSGKIRGHLGNIWNLRKVPLNSAKVDSSRSTYVWLPMSFEDGKPVIHCLEEWNPKQFAQGMKWNDI